MIPAQNQKLTARQDSTFVLEIRIQLKRKEMAQTNIEGEVSERVYFGIKYMTTIIKRTPNIPVKNSGKESADAPNADITEQPKIIDTQSIVNLQEPRDGTLKLMSFKPAVETFTFCLYSSTMASMSSELSDSEPSIFAIQSMSDAGSDKILDSSIGLSTDLFNGLPGGSPNNNHSLSTSSFFPLLLIFDLDFDIDRFDVLTEGTLLLKNHKLRRFGIFGFG